MAEANVIGKIPKVTFCLNIANISELNTFWTPEFLVQGVPWKVQVCKKVDGEKESLGVYLHCAKKEKTEDWSHPAFATFKLLPFNDSANPVEFSVEPYVFDDKGLGYGTPSLVSWHDLFDIDKKYVENDKINLDINIEAADPDEASISKIIFKKCESSCEEGCVTTFRLTVTNIKNLMAARSPQFNMRKLPWDLTVYKSRSPMLSVRLESQASIENISCKTKISAKLISLEDEEKSIEKPDEQSFKHSNELLELEVVSWNDLIKPENGFVNNNSIVIEMEIKTSKPEGIACNAGSKNSRGEVERRKIECSICFETFVDQEISSTKCGHLFCTPCITRSVGTNEKCPSCNAAVTPNDFHPVYLPFTN